MMNPLRLRERFDSVRKGMVPFLKENRYWVVLGIIYLIAWGTPVVWMKEAWLSSNSSQSAQLFILPGFVALLWANAKQSTSEIDLGYLQGEVIYSRKKEGNLSLFLIGCLLYFFAHFVRLSSATVLGLVLMLLGILYRVYGKGFLLKNLIPIAFLLLIIPALPESAVFALDQLGLKLYGIVIQAVLNRIGWTFQLDLVNLTVQGVTTKTPISFRGLYIIYAGVLFFLWHGLFLRQKITRIVSNVFTFTLIAIIMHLIRCFVVVFLLPSASGAANFLADMNSLGWVGFAIWLTFFTRRKMQKLESIEFLNPLLSRVNGMNAAVSRPLNRGFDGSGALFSKVGGLFNVILAPVIWPLNMMIKVIGFVFSGLGKSSQSMETWIQKQERRRRRQREERKR